MRGKIDEHFKVWLKDAEDLAESVGTTISTPRVTGRQRHRTNAESENSEQYFRRNLAIPFCDHLKTEMTNRFQAEDRVGSVLFQLLPSYVVNLSNDKIDDLVSQLCFGETIFRPHLLSGLKCSCGNDTAHRKKSRTKYKHCTLAYK